LFSIAAAAADGGGDAAVAKEALSLGRQLLKTDGEEKMLCLTQFHVHLSANVQPTVKKNNIHLYFAKRQHK